MTKKTTVSLPGGPGDFFKSVGKQCFPTSLANRTGMWHRFSLCGPCNFPFFSGAYTASSVKNIKRLINQLNDSHGACKEMFDKKRH